MSESDVYRRQILTYKIGSRAERNKNTTIIKRRGSDNLATEYMNI